MISVTLRRNHKGHLYGFKVLDHGNTDVCAAVSLFTLNTVNSIESFTNEPFTCDYNPEGGFLEVVLPQIKEGCENQAVDLLLNVMELGLKAVKENYSDQIEIAFDQIVTSSN